jgi:hypothetical protein
MDFERTIGMLNRLLLRKRPKTFNSSWILKNAPRCYRFIRSKIRAEVGGIDWDRVTCALDRNFQRQWAPKPRRRFRLLYRNQKEIDLILNKYRDQLYVFVAPNSPTDRRTRDRIAIALVRVAQDGNVLAKEEVAVLVRYTIDEWLDRYDRLSQWKGYDDQIRQQLEGCIRRYRYTGSFLRYVFRTLECAGRGIRPLHAYSLDEPVAAQAKDRKIANVTRDTETSALRLSLPGKRMGIPCR